MKNFFINTLYKTLVQRSNRGRGRVSCKEKVENSYKTFSEEVRSVQNTRETQERNFKIDIKEFRWRI